MKITSDLLNTNSIIGMSIAVALLLLFSFFFSGSETAITTIKLYQWESYSNHAQKGKKNLIVSKLLRSYSVSLGSLLIGNTICNIVAPSLVTLMVTAQLDDALVGLSTGILTFFVLLFCEYLPKSIARKHAIGWLNMFYILMYFFWLFFWPFCVLFNLIFEKNKKATATEKDLGFLIKTIQSEGILEQDEADLVKKAMMFDDTTVKNIIVTDMVFVYDDDSFEDVIKKFINSNYSRLPVINKKTEKAIGFILSKEILKSFYLEKPLDNDIKIKKFIKKIFCVTKETMLDDALKIIQRTNTHILAVVDSLNDKKLIGIITMEMLLEQIVGQIYDEKDSIKKIQIINDFTWIVNPYVNAFLFFKKFFNMEIQEKNKTMKEHLEFIFDNKNLDLNKNFENDYLKVLVLPYGMNNEISYEIIKK